MTRHGAMPRVMWLLNHKTAAKFEIAMLKKIGINEIFLPKHFPAGPDFRSASVDHSEDKNLSLPAMELAKLNAINWYLPQSKDIWSLVNKYFGVVFILV